MLYEQVGVRETLLGSSALGVWEASPCWVPGEFLESPEGDHGPQPLAQRGEATVHEELSAVPQQVGVGDIDGHGDPAGRRDVKSMRPLFTDLASRAVPALETSVSQTSIRTRPPQKGCLKLWVEGTEVRARG